MSYPNHLNSNWKGRTKKFGATEAFHFHLTVPVALTVEHAAREHGFISKIVFLDAV